MSKLETKFVDDIAGNFFVPSYQRGYRWGKSEVTRLLDDVYNLLGGNGTGSNLMRDAKNYCLQPIVVKRLGDDEFELIDGQQRLTTLFLIYKHMNISRIFLWIMQRAAARKIFCRTSMRLWKMTTLTFGSCHKPARA